MNIYYVLLYEKKIVGDYYWYYVYVWNYYYGIEIGYMFGKFMIGG